MHVLLMLRDRLDPEAGAFDEMQCEIPPEDRWRAGGDTCGRILGAA
jgi:hypothetical protein